MKQRWIGGLVLAMAVAHGACAPPNQGGQSSTGPSSAPESVAPVSTATPEASAEAEESGGASETPGPSSDYDY